MAEDQEIELEPHPPNPGIVELSPFQEGKPIMVSGGGRSGTTGMIRALKGLGIQTYFGEASTNGEDEFTTAYIKKPSVEQVTSLRAHRDKMNEKQIWATKVPGSVVRSAETAAFARAWNGNWLIVARDPVATAARQNLIEDNCKQFTTTYRITEMMTVAQSAFTLAREYGVVMISYEKLITHPERVLRLIAEWSGLKEADIEAGADQIRPEDQRYKRIKKVDTAEQTNEGTAS